jgi:ribosome-associated toxin RatA of RatAB toxin-antitoxin module
MLNIKTSIWVRASKDKVFSTLKDMSKYSKFMRYVKNIKVKNKSNSRLISNWILDVEGADVVWEEEDIFDDQNTEISFSMLQGDYNQYYGKWKIEEIGKKTKLSIDVYIDWGIPSFEKVMGAVLEQKTRKIIKGMLTAIKIYTQKLDQNNIIK